MFKVMSFTLQGLFISIVPAAEVSGLKAHIMLCSGNIRYISDEMTKEEAEAHCEALVTQHTPPIV